jgi:hypothetical protein
MPSLAMRFLGIESPSTIDIRLWRHNLQMRRITAATSAAKMVNLFLGPRTYKSVEPLIAEPMDVNIPVLDAYETIIAGDRQSTQPDPAPGIGFDINLLLNALWKRGNFEVHYPTPVWSKDCAGVNFLRAVV